MLAGHECGFGLKLRLGRNGGNDAPRAGVNVYGSLFLGNGRRDRRRSHALATMRRWSMITTRLTVCAASVSMWLEMSTVGPAPVAQTPDCGLGSEDWDGQESRNASGEVIQGLTRAAVPEAKDDDT